MTNDLESMIKRKLRAIEHRPEDIAKGLLPVDVGLFARHVLKARAVFIDAWIARDGRQKYRVDPLLVRQERRVDGAEKAARIARGQFDGHLAVDQQERLEDA